ncbi:hypothetical protein GGI23_006420, partial [Coemansia sp. RSA 2559]
ECRVWTNDEIRKLVEHVKAEYRSHKLESNQEKAGEHFGVPPIACHSMYYRSYNNCVKKEDAEAAKNDGKESKFMVKAVIDGAKKIASSRATCEQPMMLRGYAKPGVIGTGGATAE